MQRVHVAASTSGVHDLFGVTWKLELNRCSEALNAVVSDWFAKKGHVVRAFLQKEYPILCAD
jgi:hypothetical protein